MMCGIIEKQANGDVGYLWSEPFFEIHFKPSFVLFSYFQTHQYATALLSLQERRNLFCVIEFKVQ
jgi:hypothetical protein